MTNFKDDYKVRIKDDAFSDDQSKGRSNPVVLNGLTGTRRGDGSVKLDHPHPWPIDNPFIPYDRLELVEPKLQIGDRVVTNDGRHGTIIESATELVKIDGYGVTRINKEDLSPEPEEYDYLISTTVLSSGATPQEAAVNFVQSIVDIITDDCPLQITVADEFEQPITQVNIVLDPSHRWEFGCKTCP